MLEPKVDVEMLAIVGPVQNTKAEIARRILSWRSRRKMLDITCNIGRTDRDISVPRTQTEARLKRIARNMLGSILYHELKKKSVRKNDTCRTDQDSEVQKYFKCETVQRCCGFDDGCAKQDVN